MSKGRVLTKKKWRIEVSGFQEQAGSIKSLMEFTCLWETPGRYLLVWNGQSIGIYDECN